MSGWETIYTDSVGTEVQIYGAGRGRWGVRTSTDQGAWITAEQADAIREVLRPRTEQVPVRDVIGRVMRGEVVVIVEASADEVAFWDVDGLRINAYAVPDGTYWADMLVEVDALPTEPEPEPVAECTEDHRVCRRPGGLTCDEPNGSGWICTRAPGHTGPHITCFGARHNTATWPQEAP